MPPVHDYVIDNSTGANVRADINNVLQAILTNNSSSSAPSTTAAYMWWADTTSGTLKIRNSANDGWVELLQLDGTLTLEDGSASSPALAFRDDLNTGIFSSSNDVLNFSTGGTERLHLAGGTCVFNEDGADVDFRIEGDTQANLFYVDAGNDRIGIGTSSPQVLMHLNGQGARFQITNSATGSASGDGIIMGINGDNDFFINHQESSENILFFNAGSERARITHQGKVLINTSTASTTGNSQYSRFEVSGNSSTATGAGHLTIKAGTTTASQTNGNTLGRVIFSTLDGGDYAYIQASIDGAMGSSDFPGRMMFFTCADGASTATERMRIDKDGNVGIGMTPSGLRLDITSATNDIARFGGINSANLTVRNDTSNEIQLHTSSSDALIFGTNGENERMRITSAGQVLIGVSSVHPVHGNNPNFLVSGTNFATSLITQQRFEASVAGATLILAHSRNATQNSHTILQNGDEFGKIRFLGSDGVDFTNYGAEIVAQVDGSPGVDDMPGRIVFKTASDGSGDASERMRLDSNGRLLIQETTTADVNANLTVAVGGASLAGIVTHSGTTANRHALACCNDNGHIGGITTSGSTTSFNTSSDYRLKENATAISDGISRLKTLKPYRFNWKVDSSTTVDGFFAHEVTAVPEAITGTKDEVVTQAMIDAGDYEEGNLNDPIYQGIDQSKLVPLLVAAVKELIGKVEALEAA